jgi:hypothetical protein
MRGCGVNRIYRVFRPADAGHSLGDIAPPMAFLLFIFSAQTLG